MNTDDISTIVNRIAVVGCGHVGATRAYALMMRGGARDLVLVDLHRELAEGEAMYLQGAVPMGRPVRIRAGDYREAAGLSGSSSCLWMKRNRRGFEPRRMCGDAR